MSNHGGSGVIFVLITAAVTLAFVALLLTVLRAALLKDAFERSTLFSSAASSLLHFAPIRANTLQILDRQMKGGPYRTRSFLLADQF